MKQTKKNNTTNKRIQSFPHKNIPLEKNANIYWNDFLIPFIDAQTDNDCAFLLGMVHSHLRLGQMTLYLRASQGRLSESIGPFGIKIDQSIRTLSLGLCIDSIEQHLPAETKLWLSKFVDGINYYQSYVHEDPPEFRFLNMHKEPWTISHIILVSKLMSVDVNWFNWFSWISLSSKPYWPLLWKRICSTLTSSFPSSFEHQSSVESIMSSFIKSGSNAYALSGSKTVDSKPILASDPHLGLQMPNIWIIAGYRCPSFYITGLMFPAIPVVLIGRNSSIAWGATNMRSASSDLVELTPNDIVQSTIRTENIAVRWWKDIQWSFKISKYGPVLSDAPLFKDPQKRYFALKWVGHSSSDELSSFYALNKAHTWNAFTASFQSYAVSGQNFVYADTTGNIGFLGAVRIPQRDSVMPSSFIVSKNQIDKTWNNLKTSSDLPTIFNPPHGFIASANNKPFNSSPPVGYFFSANDRINRLNTLCSQNTISIDTIKQFQSDVYSGTAIQLRNILCDRIKPISEKWNTKKKALISDLNAWDGWYRTDSHGATIFQMTLSYLIEDYYTKVFDSDAARMIASSEHAAGFLLHDLTHSFTDTLHQSLVFAFDRTYKNPLSKKPWGAIHRLQLSHPIGRIPFIGKKYRYTDIPAPGSSTTLYKTAHTITNKAHSTSYGANARFITSLGSLDENYMVILGGQDGLLGSPHISDQIPLWIQNNYIRVPLTFSSIEKDFPICLTILTK